MTIQMTPFGQYPFKRYFLPQNIDTCVVCLLPKYWPLNDITDLCLSESSCNSITRTKIFITNCTGGQAISCVLILFSFTSIHFIAPLITLFFSLQRFTSIRP